METTGQKRALVTGGASGIGLATATRFAAEGYAIGLFDRDQEALDKVERALASDGKQVVAVAGSVTEPEDVNRAVATMVKRFGGIDCLITCAGVVSVEPAFDVSPETFRRTLDINVFGTWLAAQAAAKVMAAGEGGNIIMMGSVYGVGGAPQRTAYCASKGAVHTLLQSLAVEWGPLGIRVNGVAPTGVRTPMVQALIDEGKYNMKGVKARAPLGRLAEAEEVAAACVFLASDQASMTTGHLLAVDGGWLANGYTTTS